MKRLLIVGSLMALGAIASFADTVAVAACSAGSLASYISLGSTGCENGDKIFSNFVYTPSGADPTSAQVTVALDTAPGIKLFGLQFGSSVANGFVSNFTLSYTITIDQAACQALYAQGACSMIAAQGSFQGALAPNAAALTMALSGATTLNLDDLATANNTQQKGFTGVNATNVTITSAGLSVSAPINSFGLDVYQTAVPEPVSLSLTGLGLIGLGFFGRRRLKS